MIQTSYWSIDFVFANTSPPQQAIGIGVSVNAAWRHFELLRNPSNTTRSFKCALGALLQGSAATFACVDSDNRGSGNGSGEADGDRDLNHARKGLTATVTLKVVTETLHEMHWQACFAAASLLFGLFCARYSHSAPTALSAPSR